ncbi:MAG: trypsin-like serine protease, partial [bacterium]|nr:trypsin-like serine protease [bacterium]
MGQLSASFQSIANRVNASVVKVVAVGYRPFLEAEGSSVSTRQQSGGSGVIISSDGYVVTNAHVVFGAQRLQVIMSSQLDRGVDRKSILKPAVRSARAEVVGVDFETDLALLKISGNGLPAIEFGDSDELRPGQIVLAFGSPLGLENSVSMGVVSSPARQLTPEDPMIYIQTDAPINPGNSGGPLVNTDGEIVGINTLILSQSGGSEGLGFAAPSNIVKNVIEHIRTEGRM